MIRRAIFAAFFLAIAAPAPAAEGVFRFDMGPAGSPVRENYVAITESAVYTPTAGYGWLSAPSESFNATGTVYRHFSTVYPRASRTEPADELLIDGVRGPSDMEFQVDVPNGKYWVLAYVGDLSASHYKLGLTCNGKLVTNRADAFTYRDRGSQGSDVGGVFRVRFETEAASGKLNIRFHRAEERRPSDNVYDDYGGLTGPSARGGMGVSQVKEVEPFKQNSVLGLEIYPFKALPLREQDGKLVPKVDLSEELSAVIAKYNAGDYEAAKEEANRLAKEFVARSSRIRRMPAAEFLSKGGLELAQILLYLAGRPEIDDELVLAQQANVILTAYLRRVPDDTAAVNLRTSGWLLETAIRLRQQDFESLGLKMRSIDGAWVAESLLRQIEPDDPLYYKSLIYIARLNCGVDPLGSSPASSYRGYRIWFSLKELFPDNKYVKIYLRGVDSIQDRNVYNRLGNVETKDEAQALFNEQLSQHPPRRYDWGYDGAPEWACALRDGLGWVTDIVEWWVLNHQRADGSINAYGWSDDVELLRGWSKAAAIGHSDRILLGVTKLAEGAWNTARMDREWGLEDGRADVEHITEMVGDTLPHMVYLDYGNPAYVERSMTTVRSIRDFFTQENGRGWRLFRSRNVGPDWIDPDPRWAVDSLYAHRLGQVGLGLIWYSENPEAVRTFGEWADSWAEAARLSEKGKPAGFLPFGIAFDTGRPGFPDSQKWYDAPYNRGPLYTDAFIRQNMVYNLLQSVYRVTRDERYLEPVNAAYDLAMDYVRNPVASPEVGSRAWVGKNLHSGVGLASVLAKTRLYTGTGEYDEKFRHFMADYIGDLKVFYDRLVHFGESPYLRYLATDDKDYVTFGADSIGHLIDRRGIEIVTTEVIMTDRAALGWGVETSIFGPFTGGIAGWGGMGMPNFAVTWENLGRHTAILVEKSTREELKLLAYNFGPKERVVGMRLWFLAPGASYLLTQGPDRDSDDEPDSVTIEETFTLERRGDISYLELPAGELQVVRVRRTGDTAPAPPASDVGISSDDITLAASAEGSETGHLTVTVHNIGNEAVENLRVTIYDGTPAEGKKIAEEVIPRLPAPTDLTPKTASVVVRWDPRGEKHLVSVVVDPDNELAEITETNNVAVRPVPYKIPEWKRPQSPDEWVGGKRAE